MGRRAGHGQQAGGGRTGCKCNPPLVTSPSTARNPIRFLDLRRSPRYHVKSPYIQCRRVRQRYEGKCIDDIHIARIAAPDRG